MQRPSSSMNIETMQKLFKFIFIENNIILVDVIEKMSATSCDPVMHHFKQVFVNLS